MKRKDMVTAGAEQLFVAEHAIETALSESAALITSLGRIRLDGRVSMTVGQGAMDAASEAVMALTTARRAMVKAHGELNGVKAQLGCAAVAVGGGFDKPEAPPPPPPSGRYLAEARAGA